MARPIDRTKKSNIKCEHCANWSPIYKNSMLCVAEESPHYNEHTKYYQRCMCFQWKEQSDGKEEKA